MSEYMRFSTVTNKKYNMFNTVRILNMEQWSFYMDRGVNPVDIKVTESNRSDKKMVAFYFDKDETKNVYAEWCAYKEGRDSQ